MLEKIRGWLGATAWIALGIFLAFAAATERSWRHEGSVATISHQPASTAAPPPQEGVGAPPSFSDAMSPPSGWETIQRFCRAQHASEDDNWDYKYWCDVGVVDVGLGVFTAALALFTFLLWFATQRLVRGADKNAERQLRAYLSPSVLNSPHVGENLEVKVRYKNTGQTPAYQLQTGHWFGFEPPVDWGDSEPTSVPTIINPRDEMESTFNLPISFADAQAILQGTKRIYIWGVVKYRDAFHRKRYVRFEREWRAGGIWRFNGIGNEEN